MLGGSTIASSGAHHFPPAATGNFTAFTFWRRSSLRILAVDAHSPACTPFTILRISSVLSSPTAKYLKVVSRSECPSQR